MPNITISISTKRLNFLNKIFGTRDAAEDAIKKHLEDWIGHIVVTKYKSKKTVDEQIDEINNN